MPRAFITGLADRLMWNTPSKNTLDKIEWLIATKAAVPPDDLRKLAQALHWAAQRLERLSSQLMPESKKPDPVAGWSRDTR
jgi:hypothetical protein